MGVGVADVLVVQDVADALAGEGVPVAVDVHRRVGLLEVGIARHAAGHAQVALVDAGRAASVGEVFDQVCSAQHQAGTRDASALPARDLAVVRRGLDGRGRRRRAAPRPPAGGTTGSKPFAAAALREAGEVGGQVVAVAGVSRAVRPPVAVVVDAVGADLARPKREDLSKEARCVRRLSEGSVSGEVAVAMATLAMTVSQLVRGSSGPTSKGRVRSRTEALAAPPPGTSPSGKLVAGAGDLGRGRGGEGSQLRRQEVDDAHSDGGVRTWFSARNVYSMSSSPRTTAGPDLVSAMSDGAGAAGPRPGRTACRPSARPRRRGSPAAPRRCPRCGPLPRSSFPGGKAG